MSKLLPMVFANALVIEGVLTEKSILRQTPAGVPVVECILEHQSSQIEAEHPRSITALITAIAMGEMANTLNAAHLGAVCQFKGFLAPKGKNSKGLRLHIQHITFLEGNQHG